MNTLKNEFWDHFELYEKCKAEFIEKSTKFFSKSDAYVQKHESVISTHSLKQILHHNQIIKEQFDAVLNPDDELLIPIELRIQKLQCFTRMLDIIIPMLFPDNSKGGSTKFHLN
jgi:hypothetical protein